MTVFIYIICKKTYNLIMTGVLNNTIGHKIPRKSLIGELLQRFHSAWHVRTGL